MRTKLHARLAAGALTATAALVLAGCAAGQPGASGTGSSTTESASAPPGDGPRIALTYDGGLLVLNAADLSTVADLPKAGFLRVNSAADPDGHVMVTTPEGFQILDTGLTSGTAELTDVVFPASEAGHVTPHAGRTALFADGTGDITLFDTDAVNGTSLPEVQTVTSPAAHHGVALQLSDGRLLATIGTKDGRSGVRVLDATGTEIARSEECPAVHGEGVLKDEVVMFGCENGVLLYKNGAFVKLPAPDAYGRTGNAYVSDTSAIAVGDYRNDPDLEGYLLSSLVFVDTAAQTSTVVPLPAGASYTWRGVDRDAKGNVIVLSSDGKLHRLDQTGAVLDSWPVIDPWTGPVKWQDPHPALTVVGETAYVTAPASNTIVAFDLATGAPTATGTLARTPNEIAVVGT
jgi:hypothetical protein